VQLPTKLRAQAPPQPKSEQDVTGHGYGCSPTVATANNPPPARTVDEAATIEILSDDDIGDFDLPALPRHPRKPSSPLPTFEEVLAQVQEHYRLYPPESESQRAERERAEAEQKKRNEEEEEKRRKLDEEWEQSRHLGDKQRRQLNKLSDWLFFSRSQPGRPRGVSRAVEAAFQELGLKVDATPPLVRATFRKLALQRHPDKGGSMELMGRLSSAVEIIHKWFECPYDDESYDFFGR